LKLKLLTDGSEISVPDSYYYLTCHREENTSDDLALGEILKALESLSLPTIYPVHPRNKVRAIRLMEKCHFRKILLTEPVGYLESTCLVRHAEKIVTDSGGLQTEAFFAGKKCVTILGFVCWPETMICGRNELSQPNAKEIIKKLNNPQQIDNNYQPFGDGHAAKRIVEALEDCFIEMRRN